MLLLFVSSSTILLFSVCVNKRNSLMRFLKFLVSFKNRLWCHQHKWQAKVIAWLMLSCLKFDYIFLFCDVGVGWTQISSRHHLIRVEIGLNLNVIIWMTSNLCVVDVIFVDHFICSNGTTNWEDFGMRLYHFHLYSTISRNFFIVLNDIYWLPVGA